jgi:uncharacterized membrane protein YfcA
LTYVLLGLAAVAVGVFIGAVGVGGILLIPVLAYLGELPVHTAAATALLTFGFTGILGTLLFQRRGSIDWRITTPVCLGAIVFSVLGAWASSRLNARLLTLLISRGEQVILLGVGAASGFGSGLSGAGGPLFSVPMMVLAGFVPLAAIGTSQVLQIVAAAFGTAGNLAYGQIDFGMAAWITVLELAGVAAGVRLAHVASLQTLRRTTAGLCLVVGAFMASRGAHPVSARAEALPVIISPGPTSVSRPGTRQCALIDSTAR